MPRQQLNTRIPPLTRRELDWLKQHYGMTDGELVILAVDQLYHRNDRVSDISKDVNYELVRLIRADDAVLDHD